jgi:type IV secretion system protein VirB9
MKRLLLSAFGIVFFNALLALEVIAAGINAPPGDRRIRSMLYEPTQVFRLRGWVGYHIDLQFEPGEAFLTLGGGDLEALSYGAFENHLVIKPKAAIVHTNLTVITTRRTYIFDYAVEDGQPDPTTDDLVYSLRFSYPAVATTPSGAERITTVLQHAESERTQNFDYWFCGDSSLQPVAASDDGVHTRIRFSPRAEIPAFFLRSDDGAESLLNYSVDLVQGDVIIHRTARRLILRRGKLTGCIVNKGYTGAGERLGSGTVSPHVDRFTPEMRP